MSPSGARQPHDRSVRFDYLAVGESEVITYSYNVVDGEGGSVAQTATITITD